VNQGLLDRAQFGTAVRKAVGALVSCVGWPTATDARPTHRRGSKSSPKNPRKFTAFGRVPAAGSEVLSDGGFWIGQRQLLNFFWHEAIIPEIQFGEVRVSKLMNI